MQADEIAAPLALVPSGADRPVAAITTGAGRGQATMSATLVADGW